MDDDADVTAGPDGGVPLAVAVFATTPAFTSACVMVRVALHVVDPPGANTVEAHEIVDKPANASVTPTAVSVTLPVFVNKNENVCTSPKDAPVGAASVVMATDLANVIAFVWLIGVVDDELFDVTGGLPLGGVPEAEAVLMIDPEFTSVWVTVRVAVHVVDVPGAKVVDGHEIADKPDNGSVTPTDEIVTLPVLVTRNENVCMSPSDAPAGAVSVVIAADFDNDSVFV